MMYWFVDLVEYFGFDFDQFEMWCDGVDVVFWEGSKDGIC